MRAVKLCCEVTVVDGHRLEDADKDLVDVFLFHAAYLSAHPTTRGKAITVTSVLRPDDKGSVHGWGRGIDYAVEGMETDPEVIATLLELTAITNVMFPYRSSGGTPGRTAVYRIKTGQGGDAAHRKHVHLQKPISGWG